MKRFSIVLLVAIGIEVALYAVFAIVEKSWNLLAWNPQVQNGYVAFTLFFMLMALIFASPAGAKRAE